VADSTAPERKDVIMSETALPSLEMLEQTAQGCLTQAALFRQYLTDEENTSLLQEEYDGFRQMLSTLFQELVAVALELEEAYQSADAEIGRLYHTIDPHLY
jgi:hypothetical protein